MNHLGLLHKCGRQLRGINACQCKFGKFITASAKLRLNTSAKKKKKVGFFILFKTHYRTRRKEVTLRNRWIGNVHTFASFSDYINQTRLIPHIDIIHNLLRILRKWPRVSRNFWENPISSYHLSSRARFGLVFMTALSKYLCPRWPKMS